ncbi:conserved hypothetical protein [Truepera radiovictrix DSM 17093]|uniref:DNA-binding protein n=1 Tax=Truepera radiovictrix (strain DSM 17093 / CIP 108686 / LMG 22925 / RQ-24) TaxID=649638 RepID=D7CQE1_TRURR|nr:conserved hypothetical protein [Truepera radiovictrix DSM 17093]
MKLEKEHYPMREVSRLLGITNHKLWRLRKVLNFDVHTRGVDRREKWVSAETVKMLDEYPHKFD